jgi:hypothetical protein
LSTRPPIASFLKLPAALSSAHDHLNGKNTTAANVKSSGQFKSVNVVEHQASPSIHLKMSKKPRVEIVDKNQPPIASFLKSMLQVSLLVFLFTFVFDHTNNQI